MKKFFTLVLLSVCWQLCSAQEVAVQTGPQIEFKETLYNFGAITQGDTVLHTFIFENIGTEPLKIISAAGSCGCTVPKYSKDDILPGKKGEVQVRFNSAGKLGMQNKTVTLMTNVVDKKPIVLTIRGTVVSKMSDGKD